MVRRDCEPMVRSLLDDYVKTETKIWDNVKDLPNFNSKCDCDYPMRIQFDSISMKPYVCLKCGGRK